MIGPPRALALILVLFFYVENIACTAPNIILILTDDQDSTLGGMTPMTKTAKLLAEHGTTFINSYVASPICCPSRSSILTGMHVHNHKAINNSASGGCYSQDWQKDLEPNTFANILHKTAKYTTFYAGKYLNTYGLHDWGPMRVPPGWDQWRGLVGNSVYYNYTLSVNGKPKMYEKGEYLTDVLRDEALAFIDKQSAKKFSSPFLLVVAPPAPHQPFTPAPRHAHEFTDVNVMKTPNFNIPAGKDKHWLMRLGPSPLPNSTVEKLDLVYRSRWQSLLAVDEMVEAIVNKLDSYQIMDDTYVIFTSDNGYHMGQFSQPIDKRQPYETDIKVPLIVRGPGVESGVQKPHPTINVDLAPTILKMAGVDPPPTMDGMPLPIFKDTLFETSEEAYIETNDLSWASYDRQMLIEYHGEGSHHPSEDCPISRDLNLTNCNPDYSCKCQDSRNNTYNCVRHLHPVINFVYCSFDDHQEFTEAYNIADDPHQMKNVVEEIMPAIRFKYENNLNHLITCKGSSCHSYL